ncbi:MAG: hypothetical protein U0176_00560 [Bacteroidia bacterium]
MGAEWPTPSEARLASGAPALPIGSNPQITTSSGPRRRPPTRLSGTETVLTTTAVRTASPTPLDAGGRNPSPDAMLKQIEQGGIYSNALQFEHLRRSPPSGAGSGV